MKNNTPTTQQLPNQTSADDGIDLVDEMVALMKTAIHHHDMADQDATVDHTMHHIHKFEDAMLTLRLRINQHYNPDTPT